MRADNDALSAVEPKQVLVIHLEDLVTNSAEKTYSKILDFLELEDEPAIRKFHTTKMIADMWFNQKTRQMAKMEFMVEVLLF